MWRYSSGLCHCRSFKDVYCSQTQSLGIQRQETLMFPPQCFGVRPRVCRRGLINHAGIHPCVTWLLAETPTYDPKCVIVIEKRLPLDRVFPVEQNQYILVTDGAELALRCAGHIYGTNQWLLLEYLRLHWHFLAVCTVQLGN